MARAAAAILLALAGVSGPSCAHVDFPEPAPPPAGVTLSSPAARRAPGAVQVRYLGSGGFLIRRGDAALMTAPLFTNPFLPAYVLGKKLRPRRDLIDDFVRTVNEVADGQANGEFAKDLHAVRVLVSGHGHYDHLMDVPALVQAYMTARPPDVLTSVTGKRTLNAYGLTKVRALNEKGANFVDFTSESTCHRVPGCEMPPEAGSWWPPAGAPDVGPFRVFAVASEHPPQLLGNLFWPGCHQEPLSKTPTRLDDYPVGEVFAFLIDLLDETGAVAFRIYYEDAPLPPCRSAALERMAGERAVDLALLCTGNWREVPEAETIVWKLRAREVILHHWEWFFDEKPLRKRQFLGLPGSPADEYHKRVVRQLEKLGVPDPAAHVRVPRPGVRYWF